MIDDALFMRLANAAVWAPTAENRHFVKLRLERDGERNVILVMPTSVLLQEDTGRMPLHCLGIGALVENVVIQAATEGLHAEVRWGGKVSSGEPVAHIELARDASGRGLPKLSRLKPYIEQRVTNRAVRMAPPALDSLQRMTFDELTTDFDGVRLKWILSGEKWPFVRMGYSAESARFANEGLHREMFSGIRWSLGWSSSSDEGLPPGALGIERAARPAFKLLRHWPLMKALSIVGGHRLIGIRAALIPLLMSADLVVIASDHDGLSDWLNAGRVMQRVWLHGTSMNRAIQPVAAVALYAHKGFPGVAPDVCSSLQAGWRAILGDKVPMMCLRMGGADAPTVRAGRICPDKLVD
ncbi:MAG: hypothetical protein CVU19_13060 [Betaproteobacteria bacterium HGW-Betaproteobacteria-13]|nr:MAG: hypothetical protein CVU19_13060 [Betaproteobacteria bacterium HGW-Betaproteobacteria-13]